mgnify:CR=1 FL=1
MAVVSAKLRQRPRHSITIMRHNVFAVMHASGSAETHANFHTYLWRIGKSQTTTTKEPTLEAGAKGGGW